MKPYRDITDPTVAKALAHPLRTRILAALEGRTASPSELAAELDAPLGVLSYHVRRLTALGFIKLVRRVPRRGAVEHYYTATTRPRITNQAWGSVPAVVKQATLGAELDQIGSHVGSAAAGGGFDSAEAHLTRSPVTVDEQGWQALARELDALTERIGAIEVESHARLRCSKPNQRREASVVLMLFDATSVTESSPNGGGSACPPSSRAASSAVTDGATGKRRSKTNTPD